MPYEGGDGPVKKSHGYYTATKPSKVKSRLYNALRAAKGYTSNNHGWTERTNTGGNFNLVNNMIIRLFENQLDPILPKGNNTKGVLMIRTG